MDMFRGYISSYLWVYIVTYSECKSPNKWSKLCKSVKSMSTVTITHCYWLNWKPLEFWWSLIILLVLYAILVMCYTWNLRFSQCWKCQCWCPGLYAAASNWPIPSVHHHSSTIPSGHPFLSPSSLPPYLLGTKSAYHSASPFHQSILH